LGSTSWPATFAWFQKLVCEKNSDVGAVGCELGALVTGAVGAEPIFTGAVLAGAVFARAAPRPDAALRRHRRAA
jgi:hypothetical protein